LDDKGEVKTSIVIDTRNIWDKEKFKKVGLIYEGIGR
jgi:hypothetical protein